MGCFVRGGKNGMGCFVRGDKSCMGCIVRGGKLMRDVLSGVAKNGMGCFVPGCFVLHSSDYASSLNSDQVYCVLSLNRRAYRFSLARRVVTKKMILSPFQI